MVYIVDRIYGLLIAYYIVIEENDELETLKLGQNISKNYSRTDGFMINAHLCNT